MGSKRASLALVFKNLCLSMNYRGLTSHRIQRPFRVILEAAFYSTTRAKAFLEYNKMHPINKESKQRKEKEKEALSTCKIYA